MAAAPPPPAPACITVPESEAPISHASADATRVQFCVGAAAEQCFTYDLAGKKLERLTTPPPAAAAGARVETTSPELRVCTGDECVSLTPKVLASVASLQATTNPTGTHAIVLLGDASTGKGIAEVWDVAKARRVASIKYARGEFKCGQVAMAGDTIYLSASTCVSPAARGTLYSLAGKRLASVGGKDFGTFGTAFARVDGTTWGFLEENGSRLAIHDVVRGKLVKAIDTSALWSADGQKSKAAMGNPGESALVRIGDGKLAVIAGSPATGKLAIIDVAAASVEVVAAPVCGG